MVRLQSARLCYGLRGIRPIRFEDSIRTGKKRFAGPYTEGPVQITFDANILKSVRYHWTDSVFFEQYHDCYKNTLSLPYLRQEKWIGRDTVSLDCASVCV